MTQINKTLDQWFNELVDSKQDAELSKDCAYQGLDLSAIWKKVEKVANDHNWDMATLQEKLSLVATLTYRRGFNYAKILKNWTDTEKLEGVSKLLKEFGVVKSAKAPSDVTLSRLISLVPHLHPLWRNMGLEMSNNVTLKGIPRMIQCGSFASICPDDNVAPGAFEGYVIYQVYYDTVINPPSKSNPTGYSTVESVIQFAKAAKNGSRVSPTSRSNFWEKRDQDFGDVVAVQILYRRLDAMSTIDCKIAWGIISGDVDKLKPVEGRSA